VAEEKARGGRVYLVGAGPGDPELITVKGQRILEQADCVLYDHLAPGELLALAPDSAERIYVGKKKADHAMSQDEICRLMIDRARQGRTVVRLKGGDPMIFGRGGEELDALVDAGIPFEVAPGVNAALGIAAYSGVPLTHRDHTSAVTFVTGHDPAKIDWGRVGASETVVVFMGLTSFGEIARRLIENGRSADTPAMAVRWGTRPWQETVTGALGDLAARIEQRGMKPPATIIIGEVVALRDRFNWFERLPLFGKRVAVTRDRSQAGDLSARLRALGADAVELPAIEILPPQDPRPLCGAIERLESYDWLIFTSANGVRFFMEALDRSRRDLRSLRAKLCAIGPATRARLEELHLKVDLMPEQYVAESLVDAFAQEELANKRILLPRAAVARDTAPAALARRGAQVDVVEAYRTEPPAALAARANEIFATSRKPDWITFTSSSTVKNLVAAVAPGALQGVCIASIGPVTSATLRSYGLEPSVEAAPFTMDGLVAAILRACPA
jgi:uroporphyrinogen III methyltransferase/synthase